MINDWCLNFEWLVIGAFERLAHVRPAVNQLIFLLAM